MWVHWLLYLLLFVALIAGMYINLIGAPGLWVMVISTIVYAILTGGQHAGMKTTIAVISMAGLAELLEFLITGSTARKAGASRRGLVGALIGGIVGGILLTIVFPVILTIVGVCVGTFAGAMIGELWGGTAVGHAIRIGYGAAKGRMVGIIAKLLFGCVILGTVLIAAMPWSHKTPPPPVHLQTKPA